MNKIYFTQYTHVKPTGFLPVRQMKLPHKTNSAYGIKAPTKNIQWKTHTQTTKETSDFEACWSSQKIKKKHKIYEQATENFYNTVECHKYEEIYIKKNSPGEKLTYKLYTMEKLVN